MKTIPCFILVFIITLTGCNPKPSLLIKGNVPEVYNGYTIFLVPQPYPTAETVDSTVIKNGKFQFKVPADSIHVCDIIISRKAKAAIQKLLVAVEPGTLHVTLDTISSSHGTPLNNDLQYWKELMGESGNRAMEIGKQLKECTGNEEKTVYLKAERQRIYDAFGDSTFTFIHRNMNPLGGFIYKMMKNNFDSIQNQNLIQAGITRWEPEKR